MNEENNVAQITENNINELPRVVETPKEKVIKKIKGQSGSRILPFIDIIANIVRQGLSVFRYTVTDSVLGDYIAFFTENWDQAILYLYIRFFVILFYRKSNLLLSAIQNEDSRDTVASLISERKRLSMFFIPTALIFDVFAFIRLKSFESVIGYGLISGLHFIYMSVFGIVLYFGSDKLYSMLYDDKLSDSVRKEKSEKEQKREFRIYLGLFVAVCFVAVGIFGKMYFNMNGNPAVKPKIKKIANEYVVENYSDITDGKNPYMGFFSKGALTAEELGFDYTDELYYAQYKTYDEKYVMLIYDKDGNLIADSIKSFYLNGGQRFCDYSAAYEKYGIEKFESIWGNYRNITLRSGDFEGVKISADYGMVYNDTMMDNSIHILYTGDYIERDMGEEFMLKLAREKGRIAFTFYCNVDNPKEDFCNYVVKLQRAVKEVNIPFAEIDIRMNTTKSVGSVNNYWFVTSFAGRLSAEEFLSDNLYEIISDRYDKRDEWFTAVTNGEDSEYPFDR